MTNRNTIKAYHIMSKKNGKLQLNTAKLFHWHIPKGMRDIPIEKKDIVLVETRKGQKPVLVMDVYREERQKMKEKNNRIIKLIEKGGNNQ